MHTEALDDRRYFLDKPVDESTSKLVVTFLRNLFKKMEVDSQYPSLQSYQRSAILRQVQHLEI